jgi:hypothetical protein
MAILPFTPAGLTEIRTPARTAWGLVVAAFIGYALVVGVTLDAAATTWAFWTGGVERTAHVQRLDHRSSGRVSTWSYEIDVGGRVFVNDFTAPLEPGQDVQVLEVPGQSDVIAGNRQSTPFQILFALQGGGVTPYVAAVLLPLLVLAGPFVLFFLARRARRGGD